MNLTRRNFIIGSTAFASAKALAAGDAKPNLRVGILSDVHVDSERPAKIFEKALRYFDARKVDAVLISGDLTIHDTSREFKLVAETWFKVFPGDRRSDGVKIERLFVTGNHDVDGFAYGGAGYKTVEEARQDAFYFNRQAFWKELFHEEYRQVSVKTVKGYPFVLRHWLSILDPKRDYMPLAKAAGCTADSNPVADFLAAQNLPKDRPFFYVQHEMPNDTVNASWLFRGVRWENGHDDGTSTKILSQYPQAIALTGHCHNSLTDELSIWQGGFTAVNCSCLCGYCFTAPGRENGWCIDDFNRDPPFEMDRFNIFTVNQGLVMEVYDDAIVFERREFHHGHRLGPDWVVPVGAHAAKPYTVEARLKTSKPPCFASDAKVTVKSGRGYGRNAAGTGLAKEKHAQVFVSFPTVRMANGSPVRAWDYAVRAELVSGDVVRTLCERLVFSEGAFYAEEDELKPVVCAFNRLDFPTKLNSRQKVRFIVTPRSCFGVEGPSIASSLMTLTELASER